MPHYGQFPTAEAPSALLSLHMHDGGPLHEVDHEPKLDVLEQENFARQGIDVTQLVPGARPTDALGCCVFNAGTVALSNAVDKTTFLAATGCADYHDTKAGEEFAIVSYHAGTDQTGTPDQEWPPTDCGSSGPYLVQYFQSKGYIKGQQIAHGPQNIVSLLQSNGICQGGPFLNVWEEATSHTTVDGDGSYDTLMAQMRLGVAAGHETYISAIEKLAVTATGLVIPEQTILRVRNSWSRSWGDDGSFYLHLSTLVALGSYYDFRAFVA